MSPPPMHIFIYVCIYTLVGTYIGRSSFSSHVPFFQIQYSPLSFLLHLVGSSSHFFRPQGTNGQIETRKKKGFWWPETYLSSFFPLPPRDVVPVLCGGLDCNFFLWFRNIPYYYTPDCTKGHQTVDIGYHVVDCETTETPPNKHVTQELQPVHSNLVRASSSLLRDFL